MRTLTIKQQTAAREYVANGCLSIIAAATVAGYSTSTHGGKVNAAKLLHNTSFRNEVERLKKQRESQLEVTAEWCVNQHLIEIERCRAKGDETNATANVVWIGKTKGIYSDGVVDNTYKLREISAKRRKLAERISPLLPYLSLRPLLSGTVDNTVTDATPDTASANEKVAPEQKVGEEGDIALPDSDLSTPLV